MMDKVYLKVYFDIRERYENKKIIRNYIYHYVLNNQECGKKIVDETTRMNIINKIFELGENIPNLCAAKQCGDIYKTVTEIGTYISKFILSKECRQKLFDAKASGYFLIVENMDPMIPIEIAYSDGNFLSSLYAMSRTVPIYNEPVIDHQNNINFIILSDPTEDFEHAEAEANHIINLVNSINTSNDLNISVNHYKGNEITKDLVLFDILLNRKCNILHFSGHCVFSGDYEDDSYLVLSDGNLLVSELEEMNGNPLVFCNSCFSAQNIEKEKGIGRSFFEGFSTNFVKYGAIAFIGSVWPILDEKAMMFSEVFYKEFLANKQPVGEALRLAKINILNNDGGCWLGASYVLYGNPSFNLFTSDKDSYCRNSYCDEKAIYEIMKLEREYSGLEMLTVNEHHWMFWDENTTSRWVKNITKSKQEQDKLLVEFINYKNYFRKLCIDGKKCFKIILNFKTFNKYINECDKNEAKNVIQDTLQFLTFNNFELYFYFGSEEAINEYEIVSKNLDENINYADNICVVITQTRLDQTYSIYTLFFNDSVECVKDHIAKYYQYKNSCLNYYTSSCYEYTEEDMEHCLPVMDDKLAKCITKKILLTLLKRKHEDEA